MAFINIYITNESEAAAVKLVKHLVEEKLVACGNIYPIKSIYWWKDAIQKETEWVALVKTTESHWTFVKQEVEKIHPYEVPCIMKSAVEANEAYENWIKESVQKL